MFFIFIFHCFFDITFIILTSKSVCNILTCVKHRAMQQKQREEKFVNKPYIKRKESSEENDKSKKG